MSEQPFPEEELLRDALEEVADADPGDYVEEPWGSTALAAAEQVASDGGPPDLVELARAAVERVAANSQLLELLDDDGLLRERIDLLRQRLG